jgi:hypothetical protein
MSADTLTMLFDSGRHRTGGGGLFEQQRASLASWPSTRCSRVATAETRYSAAQPWITAVARDLSPRLGPQSPRRGAEALGNNAASIRFCVVYEQSKATGSDDRTAGTGSSTSGHGRVVRQRPRVIDRDEMVEAPRVVGEIQHGGAKWNPETAIIQHSVR